MTRDLLVAALVAVLVAWALWTRFEPVWLLATPRTPPWVGTGVDAGVGADDLESYLLRIGLLDGDDQLPALRAVRDLLPLLESEGPVRRASRARLEEELRRLTPAIVRFPPQVGEGPEPRPSPAGGTARVFLLNGTPGPVRVSLGATERTLAARAHETVEVPAGPLEIRARSGERVLEELSVAPGAGRSYVYSVEGAGGVQRRVAHYSSFTNPWGAGDTFTEVVAGESWFEYTWDLGPGEPFPASIQVATFGGFGQGTRRRLEPVTGEPARVLVEARRCVEACLAGGTGAPDLARGADCMDSIREEDARARWRARLLAAPGPRATALLRVLAPDFGAGDASDFAACLAYVEAAAAGPDPAAADWLIGSLGGLREDTLVRAVGLARRLGRGPDASRALEAIPPPGDGEAPGDGPEGTAPDPSVARQAEGLRILLSAWAAPAGAEGREARGRLVAWAEDPARRAAIWQALGRPEADLAGDAVGILARELGADRLDARLAAEPAEPLWIAAALARTAPAPRRAALDRALTMPRRGDEWSVWAPVLEAHPLSSPSR